MFAFFIAVAGNQMQGNTTEFFSISARNVDLYAMGMKRLFVTLSADRTRAA
jgi:hypothetical protein